MIFTFSTVYRFITCSIGLTALILFSACSAVHHTPEISNTQVLDISGDAQDLQVFESLSKGEKLEEPVIVKVPKGFSLPVRIAVNTPLAIMESNCSHLAFQQDLFLYISNQGMQASPDGHQWADIGDMDAVKDLFGGDKGEIAISIGSGKQEGAQLELKVTVLPKE
jgi:hypothetical protein